MTVFADMTTKKSRCLMNNDPKSLARTTFLKKEAPLRRRLGKYNGPTAWAHERHTRSAARLCSGSGWAAKVRTSRSRGRSAQRLSAADAAASAGLALNIFLARRWLAVWGAGIADGIRKHVHVSSACSVLKHKHCVLQPVELAPNHLTGETEAVYECTHYLMLVPSPRCWTDAGDKLALEQELRPQGRRRAARVRQGHRSTVRKGGSAMRSEPHLKHGRLGAEHCIIDGAQHSQYTVDTQKCQSALLLPRKGPTASCTNATQDERTSNCICNF